MRRRTAWIAAGVGAYLAFLLTTIPASAAATIYGWFSPQPLQLSNPSGTLWSGRSTAAFVAGLEITELRWELRGLSLLLGRVSGQIEGRFGDGFVNTEFSVGLGGDISLTNLRATSSIPMLAALVPVGDTIGQVSASLDSMYIRDQWPIDAAGEIRLANIEVPPLYAEDRSARVPIGSYRVQLTASGRSGINGTVADTEAPLEVEGEILLRPDGSYEISGFLRSREGISPMLQQGIEVMATLPSMVLQGVQITITEPDASGRRRFMLVGPV